MTGNGTYRTGRTMKTEPLTTVGQLKNYILRMVAKQWYDRDRETFAFVRQIKDARKNSSKISFVYSSDFDDQGRFSCVQTMAYTNGKATGSQGSCCCFLPFLVVGLPVDCAFSFVVSVWAIFFDTKIS